MELMRGAFARIEMILGALLTLDKRVQKRAARSGAMLSAELERER
jgi:hypothetical protein